MTETALALENVKYQRTATQIDDRSGSLQFKKLTFYIREINRQRDFYDQDIAKKNKLYVLGVWDWDVNSLNNLPIEYAFKDADQIGMFKVVFANIVKASERRRFVTKIKRVIENFGAQTRLESVLE